MGNKHNSSKKQNSKLLFQSPLSKTPEKSILSSNNKSDVLAKNSSYSFLNNSTQKIEMHSEINLAPFRESFKRKKKKEKPVRIFNHNKLFPFFF